MNRNGWQTALGRGVLTLLAAALLAVGFSGHAGVQVLDGATAARVAALHLHGVPGEAEYVRTHGAPAPFVHPHCHKPPASAEHQPSPDEVLAAAALAGSMHCASVDGTAVAAATVPLSGAPIAFVPRGFNVQPAVPPPQA